MRNNGNNKNVKETRACRTSNRVCEIIVARIDDFLVNRRRNKKNTGLRVTKIGQTSATMLQGQRTLVGEGTSQGVLPRRSPPDVSSPLKKERDGSGSQPANVEDTRFLLRICQRADRC